MIRLIKWSWLYNLLLSLSLTLFLFTVNETLTFLTGTYYNYFKDVRKRRQNNLRTNLKKLQSSEVKY